MSNTLPLVAGSNTSAFVPVSIKSIVAIGRLSDTWSAGSVQIIGKYKTQADADAFVLDVAYTVPTSKVLDVGMVDGQSQLMIAFKTVGLVGSCTVNYN